MNIDSTAPQATELFPPKAVLITGATGFIGQPLLSMLIEHGCKVTALTRNVDLARHEQPSAAVSWISSLAAVEHDARFDVIINLAGESLADGRWTEAKKTRLLNSRIGTTAALYNLVQRLQVRPQYLINGSAVGFYGPQQDQILNEDSASRDSFSHRLCAAWEAEADRLSTLGVDVCKLRLGVVLADKGGAFQQLKLPFQMRIATQMGTGRQYFSWIHRQDLMRVFALLLSRQPEHRLVGPINATSPGAVSYKELTSVLAKHYHTLLTLPLPRLVLRPLLGQMADELLLTGQRVQPGQLLHHGFQFDFANLAAALQELAPAR